MLAASKVKMSCREKKKAKRKTSNKIFGEHIRQFLPENNFFLVRSIDFVAVLVAVAVYYLIYDFIFCL